MQITVLQILFIILLIIIVYLYTLPRYNMFLPTIPIYNNDEITSVQKEVKNRTVLDIHLFELTDESVADAFFTVINHENENIRSLIVQPHILFIIIFLKLIVNRPRPKQLDPNLDILPSTTANTPAYPSGHAFQAYYLAYKLGLKFPEKKEALYHLAEKCAEVRVKGGHHYPSDSIFSKQLVSYIEQLNDYFHISL